MCALVLSATVCTFPLWGRRAALRLLYSIPVPAEFIAVLEDVSPQNAAMLNASGGDYSGRSVPSPDFADPKLIMWNIAERRLLREVSLAECVKRRAELPSSLSTLRLGPFRFARDGATVVGLQLPWLFSIDPVTGKEISHLAVSPGLLNGVVMGLGELAPPLEASPNGVLLATIANQGAIGFKPRLLLLRTDSLSVVVDLPLPLYANSIGWSPDSLRIAVLYNHRLDENGKLVPYGKLPLMRAQPDVEVFDAGSGRSLLRFSTGTDESRISFSHDGESLWCVGWSGEGLPGFLIPLAKILGALSHRSGPDDYGWSADVIRVYSSRNGALLRAIRGGHNGLRNNLVISPSGRFAVADASRIVPYYVREPPTDQKIGSFTYLQTATGKLLYTFEKRITGDYGQPYHFAFTNDERFLLVDSNNFHSGPGPRMEENVDVYGID
jgi:hypothetical protein